LPYAYVLDAFCYGKKNQARQLHNEEAPISLLSSLIANANRDQKKKREPYKMEDFFLFEPKDDRNIPTGVYGAAAMALTERGLLPSWALFVFKDLKEAAEGNAPSLLAYICDDAIVLAPMHYGHNVRGMIIAKLSASGQRRTMQSPCGKSIYLEIPVGDGKFYAKEDVEMSVIN
jgi:hypothetical protein